MGLLATYTPMPTWIVVSCDPKFYWIIPVEYGKCEVLHFSDTVPSTAGMSRCCSICWASCCNPLRWFLSWFNTAFTTKRMLTDEQKFRDGYLFISLLSHIRWREAIQIKAKNVMWLPNASEAGQLERWSMRAEKNSTSSIKSFPIRAPSIPSHVALLPVAVIWALIQYMVS